MKTNMGTIDKTIRIILAVGILVLFSLKIVSGTPGIILLMIAGIFVLTSFFGTCPLYSLFGIRTCRK